MIVRQVDLESVESPVRMTTNVEDRPDLKVGAVLTLVDPLTKETHPRRWRIMRLGERRAKPRQDWKVGGLS